MNISKPQSKVMEQPANAEVALSTFLALSLDLICIKGQNGYFTQLNPAWGNLLGWTESTLLHRPWMEFVHPDDLAATLKAFRQCIPGNCVEYTNRYRHKDGSYRWLFWRVMQRQDGLFYGVAKDITAAKQSEAALRYRYEFEALISTLSTQFIHLFADEIDQGINQALQEIGEFADCDRSFVVFFSEEGAQANLAYEWCAQSVETLPNQWQKFSTELFPWWMATLKTGAIQIPRIGDLSTEAVSTRLAMQTLGIQSIAAVPMLQGQSLVGYIGLAAIREEKTWSDDIVALLKIAGGFFVTALNRKQAESQLRESERRFRGVFNQTYQLSSLLRLDGAVIEDNQTAMDFCQLERCDVIGHPFWELPCWTISPETQERLQSAIAQAAAGQVIRYEEDILTPDNSILTIDFSLKPLVNEQGQVELLIAEGRDLSGRKRVEQELQQAIAQLTEWQNRYKAVGQISGQLLYEWNPETDELIWGENVEQVLGYCQGELENRITQWDKLVHPDDLEINWQAITRCKVTKEPIALEYRMRKKDGTYITVADKGQFYPDGEGNLKRMVGFIVDISNTYQQTKLRRKAESALQQALNELETRVEERTTQLQKSNAQLQSEIVQHQKTEAALQQSEELLRAIIEDQTELICRFKPEGILTFVNDAYCRYFNKERSELIGNNFIPIFSEEDQEFVTQCFNCLSQEQPIITYEHRVFLPCGEIRWQQWTNRALFDEQGHLIEFQAVGRDITPLKQAETEIRKALSKERELSELRSGFVSLVSHEFRNPLTTIQSSVDLLQRYNQKLSDDQKLNHFTRIHSAVNRMTQLLDDVLMIGKAEAGKLTFEPAAMDLEKLCHSIVENLQISASPHHKIDFVIQGDFTNVYMDEKLLGHIVNNLLSNAIKYSPEGGTVRFDLTYQDDSAIFRIQDNGIGIPTDYLEQMFETFQRAKNVGSIPGTGLGLAIVKKCVQLHGGKISVDSNIGTGTMFTVTLPVNNSQL